MTKLLLLFVFVVSFASAHRWYNWQFDIYCDSTSLFVPQNETDLSAFMKRHWNLRSFIKVLGNGHAFGNMSTCVDVTSTERESHTVSLTNFKKLIIDKTTVTVGAGWDLVELVPVLRKHGLSMVNLGTERVQNLIGAFTTGTHGTGRNLGNLATQVLAFRVMDAQGTIHTVNSTSNASWLPAYRISLGALGIITEVTIQVDPLNYLKRTTVVFNGSSNFTKMYSDILELYKQHERMMVWGPHMTWNTTSLSWIIDPQMSVTYWEPTDVKDVNNCSKNYCANGCGVCLKNYVCYDEASDAVSTPPAGVCNRFFYAEIEHFFPVENFVASTVDYTNFQLAEAPRLKDYNNMNMIYELRFVKGDQNFMSPVNTFNLGPEHSGVFGVIEIDWYMTYNNFDSLWEYQSLAKEFIPRFGRQYNVRPHWGKMSWFDETYSRFVYPKLTEFLEIQRIMDPNCQFVNEFLVHHLGLSRCSSAFKKDPLAESIPKDEL